MTLSLRLFAAIFVLLLSGCATHTPLNLMGYHPHYEANVAPCRKPKR